MDGGWLTSAYGIQVEHRPCPHPQLRVDLTRPRAGVMHTTEGSWESALSKFRSMDAPTFLVGKNRIAQLVPFGWAAAALKHTGSPPTNSWAVAQIEVCEFSEQKPWLPDSETRRALVALLAALTHAPFAIPLHRPFPDTMPAPPWATVSFRRRTSGTWGHVAGWYGHVEIPENDHWDPGALMYHELFIEAGKLRNTARPATRVTPRGVKAKATRVAIRAGGKALAT